MMRILALMLVALVAGAMLAGCGDDASAGKGQPLTTEEPPSRKEREIYAFLKRHYGDERWYPNVREISVSNGIALASTFLKFHPRQNHRDATSVCAAMVASGLVQEGTVFWGKSETLDCKPDERKKSS